jgi:nitrite reductase/ring-hydroxylating ferredoxin subunit
MRTALQTMFDDDDEEFADVGSVQQVPNRAVRFVEVDGREVMLFRADHAVVALGGNCTHAFASLRDGAIDGTVITCRRHGARFDLTNGRSLSGMCPDLPRFEVKIAGARVLVRRDRDEP